MTPPDAHSISVATDALRHDAAIWQTQAEALKTIATDVDQMRLNRVQAGQFQVVFAGYAQVIDQVVARAREAGQAMTDISTTLHASADTYDSEEAKQVHKFSNLY